MLAELFSVRKRQGLLVIRSHVGVAARYLPGSIHKLPVQAETLDTPEAVHVQAVSVNATVCSGWIRYLRYRAVLSLLL